MKKNTEYLLSAPDEDAQRTSETKDDKNAASDHWMCHELPLFDMFGTRFNLSVVELRRLLVHRNTVIWVSFATLGLFAVDPNQYFRDMIWPLALLRWAVSSSLFLLVLYMLFFASAAGLGAPRSYRLPAKIFTVPAFLLVFAFDYFISGIVSGPEIQQAMLAKLPFLLVAYLVLQVFYVRYVMPRAKGGIDNGGDEHAALGRASEKTGSTKPGTDATFQADFIEIGPRKIRKSALKLVRSEEHYLRVDTRYESLTIRAKLPEILDQVHASDGIRCHRSWWVSRHAKPNLSGHKGKSKLALPDGTEVPVARSRHEEVQLWLDLYRDW